MLFLTLSTPGSQLKSNPHPEALHGYQRNEMGIWAGGDSWQSKPWRHRGDDVPRNKLQGRDICYRALSMPPARAQRDRRPESSSPPASLIPGDELQFRAGGKTPAGTSLAGSEFLQLLLYPGKVLCKTTESSFRSGAAAGRALPHPLGALLNQTPSKLWSWKR